MGDGYTQCSPRWLNHNVAISIMANKTALVGEQATSVVGAVEGDLHVNWITYSTTEDHQNVHVEALNSNLSMVSWEVLTDFTCQAVPLGCSGTFAGTGFQFVDSAGTKVGQAMNETAITVSGDFARIGAKLCWPFVDQTWDLSQPKSSGTLTTKMSFACASEEGGSTGSSTTIAAVISTSVASSNAVFSSSVASTTPGSSSVFMASEVPAISNTPLSSSIAVVAQQASVPVSVSTPLLSTTDISEAASISATPVSSILSDLSSSVSSATEQVQTSTTEVAETSTAGSHKSKTKTEKTKTVMVTVTVTAPASYATPSGSEFCGP